MNQSTATRPQSTGSASPMQSARRGFLESVSWVFGAILLLGGLLQAGTARANPPASPPLWDGQSVPTALTGGLVFLPEGPTEGLTILMEGGRITAIGEKITLPAGCERVDVKGATITPGLIESRSQLGLTEVGMEKSSVDVDPGGDPIRSAFEVIDAYNPRSSLIPVARLGGITSAIAHASGGLFSGQSAWIDLAGSSLDEVLVRSTIAQDFNPRFQSAHARSANFLRARELFEDVRVFRHQRRAWEHNQTRAFSASAMDLEALQPVLDGTIPLVVSVNRASDIEAVIRLADEWKFKLIIAGGAEAHLVAPKLAERKIPVIIKPFEYGPGGFDQIHARADNGAILARAGVPVIISTFSAHGARELTQHAGNAVREGLDHDEAIRAITLRPAEAFGLEDYGRIAVGAVANLVVWEGDPLEIGTRIQGVYIHGRAIPLESRQTQLFRRYRHLPGTPSPAISLPQ